MKRAALERPFVERLYRRWQSTSRYNRESADHVVSVNKFRKMKPGTCGQPRCLMCHSEKIFKVPTSQEKRARANAKDYETRVG